MRIIHSLGKSCIESNSDDDASFILSNKLGGYCHLACKPASRYHGVFFYEGKMYKVIDNISLIDAQAVEELKNNFFNVERKRGGIVEKFFMPHGFNSMVYELSTEGEIEIVLDMRESYSHPEPGRFYDITEEDSRIIIKYTQEREFECFLVISGHISHEKTQKWFNQHYELDQKRNSLPYEKYVFSALKIKSKKLVFSFSLDKKKAITENDFVARNIDKLKKKQEAGIVNIINRNKSILNKIKDNETKFAYVCALSSLNNLLVNINEKVGIYAGLPWFFQFWARDEAVALKALNFLGKGNAEKVLLRLIASIKENKMLNRYPDGFLYSADAIGWIIERIYSINKRLLRNSKIKNLLSSLDGEFAFNSRKETWMDAIGRDNARIEIQALKLSMLKMNPKLEKVLRRNVREKFWNKKYLKDGIEDEMMRPNVFIAAYIYPELLNKKEWTACFEYALEKLWLDWGGLSTVDKNSQLFCYSHTGENPLSYHNGDSWFWLNNLAAVVLKRINEVAFSSYVEKIVNASKSEILWKGAIGHHAELSSASGLKSEGCLMQAWSAAMFIELISENPF